MTTAEERGAGPGPPSARDPQRESEPREPLVIRDKRRVKAGGKHAAADPEPAPVETEVGGVEPPAAGGLGAELTALRTELDERTQDLQRVTAEYANYRRRVERDRALATEEATASVFRALLPVLDDLDRAREHGELVEGVAAIVDQLVATAGKFGLTSVGEPGDVFDPNLHEAVAQQLSAVVTEPTCLNVLRRGYLLGDRLLRPAMVTVAQPGEPEPAGEPDPGDPAPAH